MEIRYESELCHYGVLGMKWGQHRARKRGGTYSYKSHGTKKFEKYEKKFKDKSKNASDKSSKERNNVIAKDYAHRAKRSRELDARMQKIVDEMPKWQVAVSALFGPSMKSMVLNKALGDRSNAMINAGVANYLAGPLGNMTVNAVRRSKDSKSNVKYNEYKDYTFRNAPTTYVKEGQKLSKVFDRYLRKV